MYFGSLFLLLGSFPSSMSDSQPSLPLQQGTDVFTVKSRWSRTAVTRLMGFCVHSQSPGLFHHLFALAMGFREHHGVSCPGGHTTPGFHRRSKKLSGISESTAFSESGKLSPASSPYPLQGANLQTFPGQGWRHRRSGQGWGYRLEGLNGSPCKLSNHPALPHHQGHLSPSPFR